MINREKASPFFLFSILLILASSMLVQVHADVAYSSPAIFQTDTADVLPIGSYLFGDSSSVSGAQIVFDVAGKTLSGNRFTFDAWGIAGSGQTSVVLLGSGKPTYILNVYSYSYTNPDVTIMTQNAHSTVTADFNLLGIGVGVLAFSIPSATCPITAIPTYNAEQKLLTIVNSGSSSCTLMVTGGGKTPYETDLNGAASSFSYGASDTLTLTGAGTWHVIYQTPSGGGGVNPPPTVSTAQFYVQVKDQNGHTVPGVNVKVGSVSTQTDSNGLVGFGSLTKGSYTLIVSAFGSCSQTTLTLNLQSDYTQTSPLVITPSQCGTTNSQLTTQTSTNPFTTFMSNKFNLAIIILIVGVVASIAIVGIAYSIRKERYR